MSALRRALISFATRHASQTSRRKLVIRSTRTLPELSILESTNSSTLHSRVNFSKVVSRYRRIPSRNWSAVSFWLSWPLVKLFCRNIDIRSDGDTLALKAWSSLTIALAWYRHRENSMNAWSLPADNIGVLCMALCGRGIELECMGECLDITLSILGSCDDCEGWFGCCEVSSGMANRIRIIYDLCKSDGTNRKISIEEIRMNGNWNWNFNLIFDWW